MYCSRCGAPAAEGASFCSRCGAPLSAGAVAATLPAVTGAPGMPAVLPIPPPVHAEPARVGIVAAPAVPAYAGFWRRFLSGLVDGVMLTISSGLVDVAMGVSLIEPDYMASNTWRALFANTAIGWVYSAGLESSRAQGTFGQQVVGIAVTDLDGRRVSFIRATVRHFAQLISVFTLGTGFLMIAFTSRKQALHDMIAGCLIVRRQDPAPRP